MSQAPWLRYLAGAFLPSQLWRRRAVTHPNSQRRATTYPNLHHRYSHDIANVLNLRLIGVRAKCGNLYWKRSRCFIVFALAVSPLALAFMLSGVYAIPPDQAVAYFGWLGYFAGLSFICIFLSWAGVYVFHGLTPSLEKVLTLKGRRAYDQWANITTSTFLQVLFACIFAVSASCALWFASIVPGISEAIYINPISFLCILINGFFIAGGAYWILAGTILAIPLTREGMMKLSWYSPVATPGIELLARCYRLAFFGACIGVSLCLTPILSWAYSIDDSWLLNLIKLSLFIASVAAILIIGIVPQWRLTRLVAEEKRRAFQRLNDELPKLADEVHGDLKREAFLLSWMQTLLSSRSTTVSESAIVGVLIGLATALAPYFLQFYGGSSAP